MDESVDFDFTVPDLDLNFTSQDVHEEGAMDSTVYLLTNQVLKSIFQDNLLPDDVLAQLHIDDLSGFGDVLLENWQDIATENWKFCFAIVFGLMVAVILPLAGIGWCCSKCFCSKKGRGNEKKNSDSICIGSGVFILFVTTILFGIFGATWYFASNSVLQNSVNALPDNIDYAFEDIQLYINNTVKQIDHLAGENFQQVKDEFNAELEATGAQLGMTFDDIKREIKFEELVAIVDSVVAAASDFNTGVLASLESEIHIVQDNVTTIKDQIVDIQNSVITLTANSSFCAALLLLPNLDCASLNSSLQAIEMNDGLINFPTDFVPFQIPTPTLAAIQDFKKLVEDARNILDQFSGDFVSNYTADINQKLDDIGESIKSEVGKVTGELSDLGIDSSLVPDELNDFVDLYDSTISMALTAPVAILCVILIFVVVGSILGCCGATGGSVKKSGSICLAISLGFFFFFGLFLWLFTVVLFFAGALTDKLVCETIRDPLNSELGSKLDEYLQQELFSLTNKTSNMTLGEILRNCEGDGQGIYTLLQLQSLYDVNELNTWETDYNITKLIDEFNNKIKTALDDAVKSTEISPDLIDKINVIESLLDDVKNQVFDKFKVNLADVIPFDKITELSAAFDNLKIAMDSSVGGQFSQAAKDLVDTIIADFAALNETIESLKNKWDELQLLEQRPEINNTFQIPEKVQNALGLLEDAGEYLNGPGQTDVVKVTNGTVENVLSLVDNFVQYTIRYMSQDVGQCGPVTKIYKGLLENAICLDIVSPLNGLWSGIGLILFFFIPGLFFICCLDNLFGREKQRPKYSNPEFHGNDYPGNPTAKTVVTETKFIYDVPDHYKGKQRKN